MKQKSEKLTIQQAFRDFIDIKSLTSTPQTINNYIFGYQVLCSEVGIMGDEPVTILNKALFEQWKNVRLQSSSPVSTSNQYLSVIRSFIYWLQEQEYIPLFHIKLIKNDYAMIVQKYSEDDIEKLLQKPSKTDKFIRWREWLIVNLMLATGVRIGSVVWLRKSDITEDSITFTHTKTHKVLTFPLSQTLKKAIKSYLDTWEINSEWLIPTQTGIQATPRNLIYSFTTYCNERGVNYKGFHALRHFFAWKMWKEGTDIIIIQHYLGHSSLEMTRHYIGKLTEADVSPVLVPLDYMMKVKKITRKNQYSA